jgi:hypothetical protein
MKKFLKRLAVITPLVFLLLFMFGIVMIAFTLFGQVDDNNKHAKKIHAAYDFLDNITDKLAAWAAK